jgi:putative phosphoribosyl transferase
MAKEKLPQVPLGVQFHADTAVLSGDLTIVEGAKGTILFANGSSSDRCSTGNRFIARMLNAAGFSTLLLDLLTEEEEDAEEQGARRRFDIEFLARRVVDGTRWLLDEPSARAVPIGYFGSSTGAAAALRAAATRPMGLGALVSRSGRPDYVPDTLLAQVEAPTLLIVGSLDLDVLAQNRRAFSHLGALRKDVEVVPGASHLFDEPGTLERVADVASHWFLRYLSPEEMVGLHIRDAEEMPGEQPGAVHTTASATLPRSTRMMPRRPCVP